ncbi:DegV family protein [Helcococcus massiliensis]|uniref:DegV family protein n=1 Tax=Helcococcus massiliensis TaxID=2040290 RepID=UPI000CDEBEF0|nr:DegV family protein [Helcococcus massiliensis]
MSIKLIIDSTADIRETIKKKIDYIVPLTVNFGNEEFIDGVNISNYDFYKKLQTSDLSPTTSQAGPDNFIKVFDQIDKNDSALVITLAANLSGTYQSAILAAQDYDNIHIVNSESVALGSGILIEYAIELIDQGLALDEIIDELEEKKKKIRILGIFDTLEYLQRGGRLSKAAAFAGEILKIKPLISIEAGEITVPAKARGNKKAISIFNKELSENSEINYDLPFLFGYTGLSDENLVNYFESSKDLWTESYDHISIGSVVGTHAGPGAIAIAYFKK